MFKNVTSRHRISARRDGLFLRDFRLLKILGLGPVQKAASVILRSPSPYELLSFMAGRLPRLGRRTETNHTKPKPAPWRDIQDRTRVLFIQRQLEKAGPCWMFNLNLEHEAIAAAKANPQGFIDFFRRRVSRQLTRVLGEQPNFWFAAEQTASGEPHIHGVLHMRDKSPKGMRSVKKALRAAGGPWEPKKRSRQLTMRRVFFSEGAVDYALKSFTGQHFGLSPVGDSFAVSRSLNAAARVEYEEMRHLVQVLREKPRLANTGSPEDPATSSSTFDTNHV